MESARKPIGVRKRALNAYISNLEERIAALDRSRAQTHETSSASPGDTRINDDDDDDAPYSDDETGTEGDETEGQDANQTPPTVTPTGQVPPSPVSEPHLVNSLALGAATYVPGNRGVPVYLGPSSDWSFCRRVLSMTHESICGAHLSPENLLYPDALYDLGWDGQRPVPVPPDLGPGGLPSSDFAIYLINTVKFHCGQLFHLLDEESFMEHFSHFHDKSTDKSTLYPLWYVHYLLILAFGKAFVSRTNRGRRPPGVEFFAQAMKLLPDFSFSCPDPVQTCEILCCAALYLQSLDFRSSAYRLIGQALRVALEHGMHTGMESQHVSQSHLQRCRKVWWTVYMLDRQMSSLMGLPLAIRDEDVSAGLPSFPGSLQKEAALRLHIKLSRVLAQIFNTIYSVKARQDEFFITNTKTVLRSIASTTDELNQNFDLQVGGSMAGISRASAYLHLLHQQCIVLTTRPLLFRLLETKLNIQGGQTSRLPISGNIRSLLQVCIDSTQRMLTILSALQEQDLLESFLPFDLSSVSNSAVVILMTASIDHSLLGDHSPWSKQAYDLLDEMSSRGNLIAGFLKSELKQLDSNLTRISMTAVHNQSVPDSEQNSTTDNTPTAIASYDLDVDNTTNINQPFTGMLREDLNWQDPFTAGQLIDLADSLDVDETNWFSLPLFCGSAR